MKITRRDISLAAGVSVVANLAHAQLGLGSLLGGGSDKGSGNIDTDVKSFLDKSINIEKTMYSAQLAIVAAYASEVDRAKMQGSLDEMKKTTDPKEAGAKFQEVSESSSAEMKKLSSSADFADQTKNLSEAKQKQVATGVFNFLIGALQAKDLLPSGQAVMKSASSNPMNVTKVLPVKDALPRLGNAITLAGDVIPKFVNVLKGANIKVPESTSKSTPEPLTSI
jgi:hypothetical protein